MANFSNFMLLFALLVSAVVTSQKKYIREKRTLGLCDFQKEGGVQCIGCHDRHICLPMNVGFTKTCGILFPYCNKGFCSRTMDPMCSSDNAEKTVNTDSATDSSATNSSTTSSSTTSSSTSEVSTVCTSESSKN